MCSTTTREFNPPLEEERIGYKAFRRLSEAEIECPYYNEQKVAFDEWMAAQIPDEEDEEDFDLIAPVGFHLFAQREAALEWAGWHITDRAVVLPVRARKIVAEGYPLTFGLESAPLFRALEIYIDGTAIRKAETGE